MFYFICFYDLKNKIIESVTNNTLILLNYKEIAEALEGI